LSGKYIITTEKEKLINSVDLAILAQNEKIYHSYTKGVRKEYAFVGDQDFNNGRLKALNFLIQKVLYPSAYFSSYENRAKNNLKKEINYLENVIAEDGA
jgi:predicted metal-dependent HD superfamily phosphohydrolase